MITNFLLTLAYGILCLYLFITGKVVYYVHPDYSWYIGIAGFVLIFLAFGTLWKIILSFRTSALHFNKTTNNKWREIPRMVLLFLPLILFVIFPPRLLSAATAQNRFTVSYGDAGISRENKKVSAFVINSEKRSFIDWIRLFAQHPQVERYKGMKANIKGFVMPHKTLPDGYIYLAQFIISCCAADARPVTIPLHFDAQKYDITPDQWLEVKGVFDIEDIDGQIQPVLLVDEVQPTDIPDEPYAL